MKTSSRICIAFMALVVVGLVGVGLWRGSSKQKPIRPESSTVQPGPGAIRAPAPLVTGKSLVAPSVPPALKTLPLAKPPGMLAFDNWAEKYLGATTGNKA